MNILIFIFLFILLFIIIDLIIKFEIYFNKDLFYDMYKKDIDTILNKGDDIDD